MRGWIKAECEDRRVELESRKIGKGRERGKELMTETQEGSASGQKGGYDENLRTDRKGVKRRMD